MRRDVFQAIADPTRRAIISLIALTAMTPNAIAEHFQIRHESPQALLISAGTCLYHDSHQSIDAVMMVEVLNT